MRECEKQQIDGLQPFRPHELQRRTPPEVRMREVDELTVEPFARHLTKVKARVAEKQAQQLATRVTRSADDGRGKTMRGHAN
jgi:hypothetical protein